LAVGRVGFGGKAAKLGLRPWLGSESGAPSLLLAHPQGSQASQDEIAASAYQAVILDQKYNDEPVQIRVPMGKEPPHLMSIFKGRMVVYQVWLLD
jgi:hypothetical protein